VKLLRDIGVVVFLLIIAAVGTAPILFVCAAFGCAFYGMVEVIGVLLRRLAGG
jgi:hypothetical protein